MSSLPTASHVAPPRVFDVRMGDEDLDGGLGCSFALTSARLMEGSGGMDNESLLVLVLFT